MRTVRDEQKSTIIEPQKTSVINKDFLPSRGKYYGSDLHARKLSAIEMKDLSKITVNNFKQSFNRAIAAGISGIDVDDIKLNDRLWLVYYLRSITFSDIPMRVLGKCKECGEPSWHEYRLKDLDVTYADTDLDPEVELPNGDKLSVDFITIGDEKEIESMKSDPAFVESLDTDVMTIAAHVKKINGESVSIYEAYAYFSRGKGSAVDYSKLISHLRKYTFGARPSATYQCPSCKSKMTVDIPLGPEFFLPEI